MHHSERRARAVLARLNGTSQPVGAEIGIWRGEMSARLLRLRQDLRLLMVDNWAPREARPETYRTSGDPLARSDYYTMQSTMKIAKRATEFAKHRRTVLKADSLAASMIVEDGTLDFVFIDAEHTYEAVTADIAAWLPKLKHGGLLSGHDYSIPGERSPKGWPGVVKAVDEAVAANGWTLDRGEEATWFVRLPN